MRPPVSRYPFGPYHSKATPYSFGHSQTLELWNRHDTRPTQNVVSRLPWHHRHGTAFQTEPQNRTPSVQPPLGLGDYNRHKANVKTLNPKKTKIPLFTGKAPWRSLATWIMPTFYCAFKRIQLPPLRIFLIFRKK